MQADNIPTIEALGEGLPPPTWAVLWDTLKPHSGSVAAALAKEFGEAPWAEVWKPMVEAANQAAGSVPAQKRRIATFADSPSPLYFLTVFKGKVQVLYGWRTCRALDADGRVRTGLLGDRRISPSGVELPPRMYRATANHADQHQVFAQASAKAPTLASIQAAFAEEGSGPLVAPEADGDNVSVWKVLPVHPKVAGLFMHSPTIKEAIALFVTLYQIVPDDLKGGLDPLATFLRLGATNAADQSALEAGWSLVPLDTDDLEFWHAEACTAYAPKVSPAPSPETSRPTGPRAEVNDLIAAIAARSHTKETGRRQYTPAELIRLAALCGKSPMDSDDINVEILPKFWRGFEAVRGKVQSARAYIETYFEQEWPADCPRHPRFWSTKIVKDIMNLDFAGRDPFHSWSDREGGVSLFSIYPLPDSSDPGVRRRRAVAYEDTMDNHRPEERETMTEASKCTVPIPDNRASMWAYVSFVSTTYLCMFGEDCRLPEYLDVYIDYLKEGRRFRHYSTSNWRALFWKHHTALRQFFSAHDPQSREAYQALADFNMTVRSELQLNTASMPTELFSDLTGTTRRPRKALEDGLALEEGPDKAPAAKSTRHKINPEAQAAATDWASLLARPLKDAKEAVLRTGKQWGMSKVFPNGAAAALGSFANQVQPTPSGRSNPCPRLFAYGKCASRRCNDSHQLKRAPNTQESRSYVDWVQARCAEIKAHPENF